MTDKIKPALGDKAPAFTLPDSEENNISLSAFTGRWVILYFYPRDNTSGCTTEALDFTAQSKRFKKLNAEIVGVSPDSCKSHEKFIIKHNLGITLLSDSTREVIKKYGVWQVKKMYGKESMGVVRSTFLINPKGTVAAVWRKVTVKGHVDDVYETLTKEVTSR